MLYLLVAPYDARQIILVTLSTHRTFLIDLRPLAPNPRLELFDVFPPRPPSQDGSDVDMDAPLQDENGAYPPDIKGKGREKIPVEPVKKKPAFVKGLFSPDGRRIFLGTKGGELLVLDGRTKSVR